MKRLSLSRAGLGLSAAALLAACGGSQPPIGAQGAMPQSPAIARHARRGGSWMLPEAKSEDLLYASDYKNSTVWTYSYPGGDEVGKLTGFPAEPAGLCSDLSGNVYVTTQGDGQSSHQSNIYEYAHGGTTPITTLTDPGFAYACAIDAATGNLAVTNVTGPSSGYGNIAVFQGARGTPMTYTDPNFEGFTFCTYDDVGNLFADGGPANIIDMLPKGGGALAEIQLSKNIDSGSIQWASNVLAIANVSGVSHSDQLIYKVRVSGNSGRVTGPILLSNSRGTHAVGSVQFWIQGRTIIGPGYKPPGINGILEFWKYPKGGLATKTILSKNNRAFFGVTVSIAPSH